MTLLAEHNGFWPYERRRIVRHAGLQTSRELGNYGKFQFTVPATKDGLGTLSPGSVISVKSSYGLPDFAGFVDRIEERLAEGSIIVSGREWAGILNDRSTLQNKVYYSGASGDIAADILRRASARNPTGIRVQPGTTTPPLPTAYTVRADRVLQGLTDLAILTGAEWIMRYNAGQRVSATFQWQAQVGRDARSVVQVPQRAVTTADYLFDIVTGVQLMQVIASQGDMANRVSSAVVLDELPALQDTTATRVQVSSSQLRRRTQRLGITTSREAIMVAATVEDGFTAATMARQIMRSISSGVETLSVALNTSFPWANVALGNTVSVHLPSMPSLGDSRSRAFRVLGYQVKESTGVLELVGKTVLDASF